MEAPEAIQWLNDLGVMFDKNPDGTMVTTHGGGTSRKRMHACADYSGAEIMRVLRDEVINRGIPVVDFTSAIELIKDEKGQVAGAVLQNMETDEYLIARAKVVIIATGGAGRLHYQASRPPITTAQPQMVWFWDTVQEQTCCTRIPFSTIRPALLTQLSCLVLW